MLAFKHIALEQRQTAGGDLRGKRLTQQLSQPAVDLDCQHARARMRVEQRARQASGSGSDFDEQSASVDLSVAGDGGGKVGIDHEILAEALAGGEPAGFERAAQPFDCGLRIADCGFIHDGWFRRPCKDFHVFWEVSMPRTGDTNEGTPQRL